MYGVELTKTGCGLEVKSSRPRSSLPMLVPQGYNALFVSILSGESKELITIMKARVQQ